MYHAYTRMTSKLVERACFFLSTNFSRTLSFLRQEKGISQRVAAQELGVSQALLSHYENGIREPGFSFLLRACDFYHVSADFLLGRTLSREGSVHADPESLLSPRRCKDVVLDGDRLARLSRQLVNQATELLFLLLAETRCEAAILASFDYLSTAVYTLFRHLYQADGKNSPDLFSVPSRAFLGGAAKIDLIASEMAYVESLLLHAKEKAQFPSFSNEALSINYADQYQALLHIIHLTGERICRRTENNNIF